MHEPTSGLDQAHGGAPNSDRYMIMTRCAVYPAHVQVLVPLLHPAALGTDMRVSLLLHGPDGSGRRTAVRAAAAALGLHCICVTCHDLQGSAGQDASKGLLPNLQAVLDDALRFAPCVLLLQVRGGEGHSHSQACSKHSACTACYAWPRSA